MMIYHDKIEKKEINPGVIFQYLGKGKEMMIYHWNMADGSEVAMHTHDTNNSAIASAAALSSSRTAKNTKSARATLTLSPLTSRIRSLQSAILRRLTFSTR